MVYDAHVYWVDEQGAQHLLGSPEVEASSEDEARSAAVDAVWPSGLDAPARVELEASEDSEIHRVQGHLNQIRTATDIAANLLSKLAEEHAGQFEDGDLQRIKEMQFQMQEANRDISDIQSDHSS